MYDATISLDLELDEATRDALRRRMASNPAYATARDAVRDPESKSGRALAAALERASETGSTGDLYRLQWLSDEDQEAAR